MYSKGFGSVGRLYYRRLDLIIRKKGKGEMSDSHPYDG